MAKPKIRHLAIMTPDPQKLAKFYVSVFDMDIAMEAKGTSGSGPVFLTDGYLNLALIPHSANSDAAVGLNHFGFHVEDVSEIADRLEKEGIREPAMRPAGRYAEYRAADPFGNAFDLSEHGFQEDEEAKENRERAAATANKNN